MRRQRGEKPHADGGRGWSDAPQAQRVWSPRGWERPRDLPRVSEGAELWLWPQLWDQARLQPPPPGGPLCGLRRHTHPLSPSSHSGSRVSCSLRGASENLQRQPHPHASQCRAGGWGGAWGPSCCRGPAHRGGGPGQALHWALAPPRSQALGPPSWGLRQGWCGPRFAGGRRGRGAGTAQCPPAAVVRPGESALCWAGPGLLDVGQEVSSRCQAASGLRVSAWLQQGLPGPPLATCSERPSGAPSPPLSALALGCADRVQGRLGRVGNEGERQGPPRGAWGPPHRLRWQSLG